MSGKSSRRFGIHQGSNSLSKPAAGRRFSLEPLETRDLMHGVGFDLAHSCSEFLHESSTAAYVSSVAPVSLIDEQMASSAGSGASLGASSFPSRESTLTKRSKQVVDPQTLDIQMNLPLLNSMPGATKTLYLDFNGDFQRDWFHIVNGQELHYTNVTTPVFDTDGNASSFSVAEQNLIKEIWARVAEDFAPFNINVSTAYHGAFENGKALQVVIGGSYNNWLKINSSGIASIGSFTDSAPNTVFVFDLVAWEKLGYVDGDGRTINGAAAIATTASHEAGHAFGLRHQALYDANGVKLNNYNPGTADWTPIMGNNLASDRTTWHYGPTDTGAANLQSNLDILRVKLTYVTDDHGNATTYASSMLAGSKANSFTGKGLIHFMGDADFFKFTVSTGQVHIGVNAAQYGPNLIPVAELWSSSGLIMQATSSSATGSAIDAYLKGGTYYVRVGHSGGYGNLGQYSVSVFLEPTIKLTSLSTSSTGGSTLKTTDTLQFQTTSLGAAPSSSYGAGQGTATIDLRTTPSRAMALPSSAKSPSRKPTYELHDEVFGIDKFANEVAAWLS